MAARARPAPRLLMLAPRAAPRRAALPLPRRYAAAGDAPLAEEGDVVFYAAEDAEDSSESSGVSSRGRSSVALGVVVGGMCYYRFVAPARADVTTGAVAADEEAQPTQCAPDAILAVVARPTSAERLRDARARAEEALAQRTDTDS
jgi:hypothetical protein